MLIFLTEGNVERRSRTLAVIEAAVIFALAFLSAFYDVFYSFDSLLRDRLYQSHRGINNKIKILAIDDMDTMLVMEEIWAV